MAVKNPFKILRESDKYEAGMDLAGGVADSLVNDVIKEGSKDFMRELLGLEKFAQKTAQKMEGELQEGEEISFAKAKQEKKAERKAEIEPGIDYRSEVIHAETQRLHGENREFEQQMEQIRNELKKLAQTSKELETTFKDVSKESMTRTVKPGKYHVNFFEWVLMTVKNARVRIESSASWLSVLSGKKSQKDYWSLSQSHGTSYSLSGERAVSQQVG